MMRSLINYNMRSLLLKHYQCQQLGSSVCLPVYYEQLVLQPKVWLEKILHFLDVPWNESVLHHEEFVNRRGGISLSKYLFSSLPLFKNIFVISNSNFFCFYSQTLKDWSVQQIK
jgi:protein-tyrosine sulfotransferase